jgi:hypothetical protein
MLRQLFCTLTQSRGYGTRRFTTYPSGLLVAGGRDCASGGAGVIRSGWRRRSGAAYCALQLGDAGGDFGLEPVRRERALIVGQSLHVIALLIAEAAEGRQGAGIVWVNRKCTDQLFLGLLLLARFFQEARNFDLGIGRLRIGVRPVVEQFERVLLAASFVEQHGEAAVALGMVRIALQALVIQCLGLLQVARAVVERTGFVQRGGQVVIALGRFWVLRDRLLEAVGRLLVVALLVEADAFDIRGLRLDVAAPAGSHKAKRERGKDAVGKGDADALSVIDCVECGLHLARNRLWEERVRAARKRAGKKVAERINAGRRPQGGLIEGKGRRMTAAVALIFLPSSPSPYLHLCFSGAARRESLADPLKPYDPVSLCNPPIFPHCFTLRRRSSDAFMQS